MDSRCLENPQPPVLVENVKPIPISTKVEAAPEEQSGIHAEGIEPTAGNNEPLPLDEETAHAEPSKTKSEVTPLISEQTIQPEPTKKHGINPMMVFPLATL